MAYSFPLIERGRVVIVNHGAAKDQLMVVVGIAGQNKIFCQFMELDIPRRIMPLGWLDLCELVVDFEHEASVEQVKEAIAAQNAVANTKALPSLKRKNALARRAQLTDFERVQLKLARDALARSG